MAASSGTLLASTQAKVILAGIVVVGGGGTAFVVTDGFGLVGPSDDSSVPIDQIPEEVDVVAHADRGLIDSQASEELMNGFIDLAKEQQMGYDGPDSYREMLDEAEAEAPLEIDGFQSATIFGQVEGMSGMGSDEYVGFIVESDWSESELVELINEENDGDLTEDSYNGVNVYYQSADTEFGDDSWLAALGDGRFVVGTEAATKDVIDVNQGDASAWSGDLREAFTAAEDGHVKMAVSVPEEELPSGQQTMGMQGVDEISIVTMTYRSEGSSMALDVQLTTSTAEDAQGLHSDLEEMLGFLEVMAGEEPELQALLENLETDQSGKQVTISYSTTVQELLELLEEYGDPSAVPGQNGSFSVTRSDAGATAAAGS